jgi:hypothetical protein
MGRLEKMFDFRQNNIINIILFELYTVAKKRRTFLEHIKS